MLRAIRDLVLYRIVGGRVMLAIWLLGLARRLIGGRRGTSIRPGDPKGRPSVYQPSQGSSQTVQRDPR